MSICLGQVSSMSKRKVLFLLEGDKAERKILTIIKKYYPDVLADFYVVGSNLFDLDNHMKNTLGEDWLTEDSSIISTLVHMVSLSGVMRDTKIDVDSFTDVFLIFDYEISGTSFSASRLMQMQKVFSDSTKNGLLLLSYPMVEAYRHLKSIPDDDYLYRAYDPAQEEHYKTVVGRETGFANLNKYDKVLIDYIFTVNKQKLEYYVSDSCSHLSDKLYEFLKCQCYRSDVLIEFTMILFLDLYNIDFQLNDHSIKSEPTSLFS